MTLNDMQNKTINELNLLFENSEAKAVYNFIESVNKKSIEFDKWYYIDENKKIKAILLNKSNSSSDIKEYHKLNTDIHITLKGKDKIFIGSSDYIEIDNKIDQDDYCLVNSKTINEFLLNENEIVIINPGVIHCNILEKESIKIVIKKQNG